MIPLTATPEDWKGHNNVIILLFILMNKIGNDG
jgi:hypothetical protein